MFDSLNEIRVFKIKQMKFALIFLLSAVVALSQQQFLRPRPHGLVWWSPYLHPQPAARNDFHSGQSLYDDVEQEVIPTPARRFRPSGPIAIYQAWSPAYFPKPKTLNFNRWIFYLEWRFECRLVGRWSNERRCQWAGSSVSRHPAKSQRLQRIQWRSILLQQHNQQSILQNGHVHSDFDCYHPCLYRHLRTG